MYHASKDRSPQGGFRFTGSCTKDRYLVLDSYCDVSSLKVVLTLESSFASNFLVTSTKLK
jgi:hypothetical protein